MENPFRWVEIYVQEMNRAKKFYESVLGLKLEKLDSGDLEIWAFPMKGDKVGAGGALVKMEGVSSGAGGTISYFGCDDCAVEAARVVKSGGKIHKEKFPIGQYGFIALAFDTEGNMFGLHSMA
jgi:uncharacterized protein